MDGTHVPVAELSAPLRDALKGCGYGGQDVRVIPAATVETTVAGGAGMRGFVTIVNVENGRRSSVAGSWGGGGFDQNPVDQGGRIDIPENGAVVKGTTGYPRTFATIYAHPLVFGRMLPAGDAEALTEPELDAIYCHTAIKGGAYRREEMSRRGVTADVVDGLVERGYLKRNRAGATQATTKGKNARDGRM